MKKVLLAVIAALAFTGCAEDRLRVIHNNDRVSELERRAALNDQLNSIQNDRLSALEAALAAETQARIEGDLDLESSLQAEMDARIAQDAALQQLIEDEQAARIAGDDQLRAELQIEIANRINGDRANSQALTASVLVQSLVNLGVQLQLSSINSRLNQVNSRVLSLTSRVSNLEENLENLEQEVADLRADQETVRLALQAQIDSLSTQQAATQAQLDREGVKLFKCNSSSSTERIMKINGKFYAVMNRVQTQQVQVITGSSSTTFTNPKLCLKDDKAKLPGGNGQCPSSWAEVGGNTVTVPSYSTANRTVVTDVKIALDLLSDGNYQTTDGGPACSFSISNGGTSSTNLIAVQ
jgi:hypothetical protein